MRTNYLGHDGEYRRRKSAGYPGWAEEDTLKKNLRTLEFEFAKRARSFKHLSGRSVLEIGCGAGDLSIWLAETGFEVHGIDVSPSAITWAKQKAASRGSGLEAGSRLTFQVGSVLERGALTKSRFDLVVDGHCLHCIIGADRETLLANVRYWLKPDGILFVKTMCGDLSSPHLQISESLKQTFDPASRCVVSESGIASRYIGMPDDIKRELEDAGFDLLAWRIKTASEAGELDELLAWCQPRS